MDNSYLCGYLKIKGLTEEFPTLTTFFDGEIISAKFPFLTRKWDADEDVDRKHWVRTGRCCNCNCFYCVFLFCDFSYNVLICQLAVGVWQVCRREVRWDERNFDMLFCRSRLQNSLQSGALKVVKFKAFTAHNQTWWTPSRCSCSVIVCCSLLLDE